MLEILHSFAIGIAAAIGFITGIIVTHKYRADGLTGADIKKHHETAEERLAESVSTHKRIAVALENLVEGAIKR